MEKISPMYLAEKMSVYLVNFPAVLVYCWGEERSEKFSGKRAISLV